MLFIKKIFRNLATKSIIFHKLHLKLNSLKVKLLSFLNDDIYAKINYKENTNKKLNLDNPTTFDEKLWWLKNNYRTPLMTQCSDKVTVRDYLTSLELTDIIIPMKGAYSDIKDIPFSSLKGKFFIKCNHVSGTNMVFESSKADEFDHKKFKWLFSRALKQNYYLQSREWNYKNIKPKILIEEFLESENLLDYKFFCFNGKVHLLMVDKDVATEEGLHSDYYSTNYYDREYNFIPLRINDTKNFDPILAPKPENFEEMLLIAEKISKPFPFCRVDLYNIDGQIKFGEITFHNEGAKQIFSNKDIDLHLGSLIKIDYSH